MSSAAHFIGSLPETSERCVTHNSTFTSNLKTLDTTNTTPRQDASRPAAHCTLIRYPNAYPYTRYTTRGRLRAAPSDAIPMLIPPYTSYTTRGRPSLVSESPETRKNPTLPFCAVLTTRQKQRKQRAQSLRGPVDKMSSPRVLT